MLLAIHVAKNDRYMAMFSAAACEPAKSQFLRPRAMGRMAFSMRLLCIRTSNYMLHIIERAMDL